MARRIALVSCCGEKLGHVAPARQLYRSQLFRKSAAWVEQQGLEWFVLSAAYGLIKPDDQLAPYDKSAARMSPEERAIWASMVAEQIDYRFSEDPELEIVLLAGQAYTGWIPMVAPFCKVEQPLQGMQIGERLRWLTEQLHDNEQEELFS